MPVVRFNAYLIMFLSDFMNPCHMVVLTASTQKPLVEHQCRMKMEARGNRGRVGLRGSVELTHKPEGNRVA